jgi:hypothetical protein
MSEGRDEGRARAIDVCQTSTVPAVITTGPGLPVAEMVLQYQLRPQYHKVVGGPRWVRHQCRAWWSWRFSYGAGWKDGVA